MSLVNKFYGEGKNSQDSNQKSWLCQYPVCLITDCVAEKVMRSVMSVRPCLCTLVQNMFIPGNGSVHSARTVIRELQFRSVHVL